MTVGEITALLIAIVGLGGFFLSMRSTSFTELKSLHEGLKNDFDKYKKESEEKEDKAERQREEMENEIKALTRQADNFKRYIAKLIAQIERLGQVPEKMDPE